MRLVFLGCGDAFSSGGRFNTCFLVERGDASLLIDGGASSLVAMRRAGVVPNAIDSIVLSHLHGDHFGGLPFLILDGQLVSKRTRPLTVAGPVGLAGRIEALMDAMFPGSWSAQRKFEIRFVELPPGVASELGENLTATGFLARHPSGSQALALRIAVDGATIAYTGDTEWTDSLIHAGKGADLLIAEAYTFDRKTRFHLDYATLREHLPEIAARRTILTHLSEDMLQRASEVELAIAQDGMEIDLPGDVSRGP